MDAGRVGVTGRQGGALAAAGPGAGVSPHAGPFSAGKAGDFRAAPEEPEADPGQQLLLPAPGRADAGLQWYGGRCCQSRAAGLPQAPAPPAPGGGGVGVCTGSPAPQDSLSLPEWRGRPERFRLPGSGCVRSSR